MRTIPRGAAGVIVALTIGGTASTQSPETTLRGTWAATNGRQTYQGTWTAQSVPDNSSAAQGSWTLINQASQIVASGTWSAAKAARGWNGSWQARIVTGGGASGAILSGTWNANVSAKGVSTLTDLFRESLQQQISGTWARGGLKGAWSIRGSN